MDCPAGSIGGISAAGSAALETTLKAGCTSSIFTSKWAEQYGQVTCPPLSATLICAPHPGQLAWIDIFNLLTESTWRRQKSKTGIPAGLLRDRPPGCAHVR